MLALEKIQKANQRLFDEALKHICKQGRKSAKDQWGGTNCMYRSPEGLGCAFAPAIKNYISDCEGQDAGWFYQDDNIDYLHDWAKDADPELAATIQLCHDDLVLIEDEEEFVNKFKINMQRAAERYELQYIEPTE